MGTADVMMSGAVSDAKVTASAPVAAEAVARMRVGEIFYTLGEARVLIEQLRNHYKSVRPYSSLGYRPPTPRTILPAPHVPNYPDQDSMQKERQYSPNRNEVDICGHGTLAAACRSLSLYQSCLLYALLSSISALIA